MVLRPRAGVPTLTVRAFRVVAGECRLVRPVPGRVGVGPASGAREQRGAAMIVVDVVPILVDVGPKDVGGLLSQTNGTLSAELVFEWGPAIRPVPEHDLGLSLEMNDLKTEGEQYLDGEIDTSEDMPDKLPDAN